MTSLRAHPSRNSTLAPSIRFAGRASRHTGGWSRHRPVRKRDNRIEGRDTHRWRV